MRGALSDSRMQSAPPYFTIEDVMKSAWVVLGRLRAAVFLSLSIAACSIALWALDATSAGSAAGQWTVTKLRLTGGRFDLPVKVGTPVIIESDGFFALEDSGANRIGILGRGLCGGRCFTLYNFWVSQSYDVFLSPDSDTLTFSSEAGFRMIATRQ